MYLILGTFFDFTETDVSSMIGYTKDVITDFTPILIPIIAVAVGVIILTAIIHALKSK